MAQDHPDLQVPLDRYLNVVNQELLVLEVQLERLVHQDHGDHQDLKAKGEQPGLLVQPVEPVPQVPSEVPETGDHQDLKDL